jgi:hypothetical protein
MPSAAERTWAFWKGALEGDGFQIIDDPATHETEPYAVGRYDVAQIVRGYQQAWAGKAPNHLTPIDMLDLLLFLDDFTRVLEQDDLARRMRSDGPRSCESLEFDFPQYAAPCRDLARWRRRLDEYLMFTSAVPVEQQSDREAILWNVTAPLFVGWYGGETGVEIPLDPQAFPPGFNPAFRHPADIATPYSLANQFGIYVAWEDERKRRLVKDLTDPLIPSPTNIWLAVAVGALLLGGYAVTRN